MDVVHVPDVVANRLVVPFVGAGLQVHRDDAVGEQIFTRDAVLRPATSGSSARCRSVVGHAELGIERPVDPRRHAGNHRTTAAIGHRRPPGGASVDRIAVHIGDHRSNVRATIERPDHAAVTRFQGERCIAVAIIGAHIHHAVVINGGDLLDVAERGAAGARGLYDPDLRLPCPCSGRRRDCRRQACTPSRHRPRRRGACRWCRTPSASTSTWWRPWRHRPR